VDGRQAVHERLRDVRVFNRPGVEVIRQEDGPATQHYADPPYVHGTRAAPGAYGRYEMNLSDHRELLDTLRQCKGKVILSGYDNGLYNTVLSDWNRHTFDLPNNTAGGGAKRRMTEVIWCNF
jgi:DNA adenine methylase